jgi:hypothetical protein
MQSATPFSPWTSQSPQSSPGRPSLLHPVAACNSGLAMGDEIPPWFADELIEAVKFAIGVQELQLANRVLEIEAREQQLADRLREIEAREQKLADRGRIRRMRRKSSAEEAEKSSAEEAERAIVANGMAVVALQAAGTSSGDPVFAEAAAKLQTEVHAQTVASALLLARRSKASGAPSAVDDIKNAELALRDVLVLMCSSRAHPGNRDMFEASARESFGGSLDTDMRSALFLSWHKWRDAQQTPGTPSNNSRRKHRPRRPRAGKPGDDVYPVTYGPWRVCCRCLGPIGDLDDDGLDKDYGGTCSLGMAFFRCLTCGGLCHCHGVLNGTACRDLPCRAAAAVGGLGA